MINWAYEKVLLRVTMNIKRGLRRIFFVILSLFICYFLLIFIIGGGIFWKQDYIFEAKVQNTTKFEDVHTLVEFSNEYFQKENPIDIYYPGFFDTWGFSIHPYKRFFVNYDGHIFKDKEIYTINNTTYQVQLPSAQKYFITQLWQFLLIPFGTSILLAFYLFVEWIITWIIKGFK